MDPLSAVASAITALSSAARMFDSLDRMYSNASASQVASTLSLCSDVAEICQSLGRLRSPLQSHLNENGRKRSMSPQRRKQSSEFGSSLGPPCVTASAIGRLPQLPEYSDEYEGTENQCKQEIRPLPDAIFAHVPKRANPKLWCSAKHSMILRPLDSVPEFQPRRGPIMTLEYDANPISQDWGKSSNPRQNFFDAYVHVPRHHTGNSKHYTDGIPQIVDRIIREIRDSSWGGDAGKYFQVVSHCWGRQRINNKDNTVTSPKVCKYTFNDGVGVMPHDSCEAGPEQVASLDALARTYSPGYRKSAEFAGYGRRRKVRGMFIYPLMALGYPMTVSAATLSWRCNLCSSEPALLDMAVNPNAVSMLPIPPGRHIIQYLALCSVVFLLVYLQGTGTYLKYSFMASSGLLALICILAGTETMLRCLPLVVLVTLLISRGCQVLMKIMRGLPRHEVQVEPVAASERASMTSLDRNSKFSVI